MTARACGCRRCPVFALTPVTRNPLPCFGQDRSARRRVFSGQRHCLGRDPQGHVDPAHWWFAAGWLAFLGAVFPRRRVGAAGILFGWDLVESAAGERRSSPVGSPRQVACGDAGMPPRRFFSASPSRTFASPSGRERRSRIPRRSPARARDVGDHLTYLRLWSSLGRSVPTTLGRGEIFSDHRHRLLAALGVFALAMGRGRGGSASSR